MVHWLKLLYMRILTSLSTDRVIAVDIANNVLASADSIKELFVILKKQAILAKKPISRIQRQTVCKGSFSMGNYQKYKRDQVNLSNGLRKRDF